MELWHRCFTNPSFISLVLSGWLWLLRKPNCPLFLSCIFTILSQNFSLSDFYPWKRRLLKARGRLTGCKPFATKENIPKHLSLLREKLPFPLWEKLSTK